MRTDLPTSLAAAINLGWEIVKMKILMSTAGSHGDVLPFIALGREFLARGHEVVLYANPYFQKHVLDAGLAFTPIKIGRAHV